MKNVLRMAAFGAALCVAASTVPSLAFAAGSVRMQDQNHNGDQDQNRNQAQHPDYANNSHYTQGNNDGYQDYKHKTHKDHHRKFNKDADRQAYEYGYQQGSQGQRGYHDNNNSHQ